MGVTRAQVRSNLMNLMALQTARDREFGALLLAVWVHAEEDGNNHGGGDPGRCEPGDAA